MSSRTRILIVEDNQDLAFGLRHNLEFEGYAVGVAETGREGLELARSGKFDLVILDLMLPDMEGFKVLEKLREHGSDVPVLFLTARGDELDKVRGLRLGADDYLTKPFRVLELLARVEAVLRRTGRAAATSAKGAVYTYGDIDVRPGERVVLKGGEEVGLTPKEFDLLVALLVRQGSAASRLELLEEVWGHKGAVESRTVDTHVGELRRKLEADPSNPDHLLTVRKVGYRLKT